MIPFPIKPLGERRAAYVAFAASASLLTFIFLLAAMMRQLKCPDPGRPQLTGSPLAASAVAPLPLSADAAEGRHLFLMNCAHCHADDAHGDEGPDLYDLHKSDGRIHQVITTGIKGEMPSFAKKLNDSDIRSITAYLRTLHNSTAQNATSSTTATSGNRTILAQ